MRVDQKQIIASGDMSGNITSTVIDGSSLALCSFQASWTGASPVGALTFEVSNDLPSTGSNSDQYAGVTNWTTYPSSSQAVSGNTGTAVYTIADLGYRWVRVKYAFTSGTGTLNVMFVGKGV